MLAPDTLVLDGRFRILRRLGGGGMGDVYLAEQVSLGRKVALKLLRKELGLQAGMEQRFRREAKLLSSVEHPAVVRVIDFGKSDEGMCLVMELAEGETLHQALDRGLLPLPRALGLLAQLADGLAAIHQQGIVHRDLKPENVVLSRTPRGEQARLLDFGIAKLAGGFDDGQASGVSQVGLVLGTPEYLSPEQAVGAKLDAKSDLYSFGVLAFRTLSGKLPFVGPAPRQFLAQHVAAPPIPITDANPALAKLPAVAQLVMRCLEKDPASRPASAEVLANAFARGALDVTPSTDAPAAPPPSMSSEALPYEPPPPSQRTGTAAFAATTAPAIQLVPARNTQTMPSGNAKPQNLTLMLTDIVGFTARTSRQTREESARMLEEHDQLLLPAFKARGGRVLQKRGDAFLVGFPSPTESVLCGMELQDRLWRRNRLVGRKDPLEVRVAIHLGEVLLTKDGPVGEPVQILAAVEEAAGANEVVFTEAVNLAMIRAEVQSEDRGLVTVPGRGDRLRLYRCRPIGSSGSTGSDDGPPFGGRDLPGSGRRAPRRSLAAVLRARPWLSLSVLVLLAAGVGVPAAVLNTPARKLEKLLADGKAAEVLAQVEALPADQRGELEPLRIAALHALDRHRDELPALRALSKDAVNSLPEITLQALTADYARDGDPAERKLLGMVEPRRLKALVGKDASMGAWGAVRYLDQNKAAEPELLARGYLAALASDDCGVRGTAARRLGELDANDAAPALEKLTREPKRKLAGLVEVNCGQDEAKDALRALQKSAAR